MAQANPGSRLGSEQARIFTMPLRPLTPATSLGFQCIDFAKGVLGIDLLPWQQWLVIHALELRPDGNLRFRTVIVLVARQNGKSLLSIVIALFFMYVLGKPLVIGTAQDLDMAEEIWQGAVDLVEETPALDALKARVVKTNGKKSLELQTGSRWKVKAANRRAGRGLSGDLTMLDELREHQSWEAWAAITKTTMARESALILALSNAGDVSSVVLRHLRLKAHAALGDPDRINAAADPNILQDKPADVEDDDLTGDDTLAIFEWSAPIGCGRWDRDGWAWANPALGHTISERTIAAAAGTDPEWVFRTEVLCQWSDGAIEGPFPPGAWDQGLFTGTDQFGRPIPAPQIVGKVSACIDVSADRSTTFVAFAGRNSQNRWQVEIVARRAGDEWVAEWLRPRLDVIESVTGQGRGAPVSPLLEELSLAGFPVEKWEGPDLPNGTARFYDAIRDNELVHLAWPELDLAAATAIPRLTEAGSFMWDRKRSPTDVAALMAATGAYWLASRPTEPVAVSAYETRGLEVL